VKMNHQTFSRTSFLLFAPVFLLERIGIESSFYYMVRERASNNTE
jgi:hypothetical protein